MFNIKNDLEEELVKINKSLSDINALKIICTDFDDETDERIDHVITSIDKLDYECDKFRYVDGIILFNDNSWLSRREYDSWRWWHYNKCPTIDEVINFIETPEFTI